jgi:hypothetical protein
MKKNFIYRTQIRDLDLFFYSMNWKKIIIRCFFVLLFRKKTNEFLLILLTIHDIVIVKERLILISLVFNIKVFFFA